MDSETAYDLFKEKLFIDLTLRFQDDTCELIMHVHKCILYASCDYFKKLLILFREGSRMIL
jgi:BTB/POZ domain